MRLINTSTLQIHEFRGEDIPAYGILSHTWGDDEASFQSWGSTWVRLRRRLRSRTGFRKVAGACRRARLDGLGWMWVDTVCIDKASSAELSEAINSMYAWYEGAEVCYVWLGDVGSSTPAPPPRGRGKKGKRSGGGKEEGRGGGGGGGGADDEDPLDLLRRSRWFTRGWTLQELLAPSRLIFFAADWTPLGTKNALAMLIADVTGVEAAVLHKRKRLDECAVAQRMSWAAGRRTTRAEDEAYCLMGLFGINMPLLYGEGRKAFRRLQEEIIRAHDDHSILAFETDLCAETSLFAHHPDVFRRGRRIRAALTGTGVGIGTGKITAPFGMTNAGLSIATPLVRTLSPFWVFAVLNCIEVQSGGGGGRGSGSDGHEVVAAGVDETAEAAVVRRAQVCLPLFGKDGKYMRARAPVSLICKVLDDDDNNDDYGGGGGADDHKERGDQIRDLTTRRDSEFFISYFSRVYSAYGTEMDIALKGFGSGDQDDDDDDDAAARASRAGWLITFPRGTARYQVCAAWPPRALRADISFFIHMLPLRIDGDLDLDKTATTITITSGLIVFRDDTVKPARHVAVHLALEIEAGTKLRRWTCRLVPVPPGFQPGQVKALAELADLELAAEVEAAAAAAARTDDKRSDSDEDGSHQEEEGEEDKKSSSSGGRSNSTDEEEEVTRTRLKPKKEKKKRTARWRHYHQLDDAIVAARTRFSTLKGEPCSEAIMLEIVFDAHELMRERDVDIIRQSPRVVLERKTF